MCIKIIGAEETKYDMSKPLEEQLAGSKQVIINYDQNDPSIEKFVGEVERICTAGVNCELNVTVHTNSHIKGAKVKRQAKELEFQIKLNNLIKFMALSQHAADKKLEEIAGLCGNR